MTTPLIPDHPGGCRQKILDLFTGLDCELNVGPLREPFVFGPFTVLAPCPHGVVWLIEPTNEQRIAWRQDAAT